MSGKEFISFVIIAHNEAVNIANSLASITALDGLGDYEIIVVDDGSNDGTADIVRQIAIDGSNMRLIRLDINRGRGYARNRGVSEARGKLIATIDADIVLPRDWLTCACEAIADRDAVGGTAVPDGDVSYLYKRFRLTPRVVGHTTAVTGSNALYRRRVFDMVGFDPNLREGEDVALNHAINRLGLSSATIPGLLVAHSESKGWAESLKWLYVSGKGATRQLLTYREIRPPDIATGGFGTAVAFGVLATARGHCLFGVAVPVGFVLAASAQHVRSRFETPVAHYRKLAPAVAADGVLLTAYFIGRIAGLSRLCRRKPKQKTASPP